MNPFHEYDKSDISNVVLNQDYFRTFDENEDHLLLDMDSLVQRKDNSSSSNNSGSSNGNNNNNNNDMLMSRIYNSGSGDSSAAKKCSLGEEPDDNDGTDWQTKPIEDWCQEETINWLMMAAATLGQSYGSIQQNLALPGKELTALSRHDFIARDPVYGERLYNLLHTQAVSSQCKNQLDYNYHHSGHHQHHHHGNHHQHHHHSHHHRTSPYQHGGEGGGGGVYNNHKPQQQQQPQQPQQQRQDYNGARSAEVFHTLEDEPQVTGSNNASDAESDNSVEVSTKRPPGRPRLLKTKKNPTSQGKLWEFIRDLLRNRKTCPSLICWEDYSQAKFRFVRSDEVAKLWGSRKGNTKMTYEKLSRAMRYYYKRKIFLPVLGRRLVYQFGPNATGWQTDNPNFRF